MTTAEYVAHVISVFALFLRSITTAELALVISAVSVLVAIKALRNSGVANKTAKEVLAFQREVQATKQSDRGKEVISSLMVKIFEPRDFELGNLKPIIENQNLTEVDGKELARRMYLKRDEKKDFPDEKALIKAIEQWRKGAC